MTTAATPMFRQYLEVKRQYPDAILFFRLGDFYEMFYEDAVTAARALDIVLTSREAGNGERVPMCGVPHHAADAYLARLVEQGHRVAVCDQVEDPKGSRGLVRREVVRVVTPGTVAQLLPGDERGNHYIAAVAAAGDGLGLAAADVATGAFLATQFEGANARAACLDELYRLQPAELVLPPALAADEALAAAVRSRGMTLSPYREQAFEAARARQTLLGHFRVTSLAGYGLDPLPVATLAAGGLLAYLLETQKVALAHLTGVGTYHTEAFMYLDETTRRNLELCRRLRDGARKGSLLGVVDHTLTPMGGRLLRAWLERPLLDLEAIAARQDAIEDLVSNALLRTEIGDALATMGDLERLAGRVAYQTANGRDLLAVAAALNRVGRLKAALAEAVAAPLRALAARLDPLTDLTGELEQALVTEPPAAVTEGGVIRPGYHPEVDRLREAARSGKGWVAALEAAERERTGIKSLKVGFNKVFGYYIEVTRPNLAAVPPHYQRRQTLANAERFVTPELKEREELILTAEERLAALEYELFVELRARVAGCLPAIQTQAALVAELDCLAGLATLASSRGYCRPQVHPGAETEIDEGRHPVVEAMMGPGGYVPNGVLLNDGDHRTLVITGPNMAGKSTYCRQVALIVLLAQVGSFVPARQARIGLVDRIFTRVGAHDDLALGQSTFMVEMVEVGNILNNATRRSLVVLDEIGRGTSTYDGLSIAWAVAEHIHERIGARTLLATHYRELTQLESLLPGVCNYHVAVQEQGKEVVFLRRIVRGGADASYGIHVARLAGVPPAVLARAEQLLAQLEAGRGRRREPAPTRPSRQLALLGEEVHPALAELRQLNVLSMTPLEALDKLYQLQQQAREGRR